ncbi:ADP-ribosylglycohydrolase family protein [Maribellus sp. YY47]|uniref:ADP-ribosylglycohydrolase family protein n=1 Tax=Maribellus sp. YY47 TaxID=2929486 RepID=UPI0020015924|nr:ADP-ribosylglycohydrolase family protein [Maribellus sp. YY47]MCK3685091.1 ADP-ribosylglycohydrolase family protein [Maribellus sp. YY47]
MNRQTNKRDNSGDSNDLTYKIKSALFGVAVGDALGVPVEFKSRKTISENPVTDMIGYGTYNLPAGTWSDDSSLTFCLAEALTQQFDTEVIGKNFVEWLYQNHWTPGGTVFDIGIGTRQAIDRLAKGKRAENAGNFEANSNGNGSLMRILPLLFYCSDKPTTERFELTRQVSSITHGHIRSITACFYYLEFARHILQGKDKFEIYKILQTELPDFLNTLSISRDEIQIYHRLLENEIFGVNEERIYSDGYVVHTLEASIWCLMTTDSYKDAVLKAVNLGDDTDTTAAVTGGLAGLLYGFSDIPGRWINSLAKYREIENLCHKLGRYLNETGTNNAPRVETEKNYYRINMQKALFVARELHKRGYEKLRVVPCVSPSGMSWRCSFVTEKDKAIISNWISSFLEEEINTEINYSITELTNCFEREHTTFLETCKGTDKKYKEWYKQMLNQLEEEELPYAFGEYFSPTDYWDTSKNRKIATLPNEARFYKYC